MRSMRSSSSVFFVASSGVELEIFSDVKFLFETLWLDICHEVADL